MRKFNTRDGKKLEVAPEIKIFLESSELGTKSLPEKCDILKQSLGVKMTVQEMRRFYNTQAKEKFISSRKERANQIFKKELPTDLICWKDDPVVK